MKKRAAKGFTLMELMISAAILVTAIIPVLLLFYNYLVIMEMNRNTTIAVNDASFILESMISTPSLTVSKVVTDYPQGADVADMIGNRKLTNETIVVSYQDTTADPLVVTVQVNWQDQVKVRNRVQTITTKITAR